jgi:uncharacterized protein YidB (DUF937 family)
MGMFDILGGGGRRGGGMSPIALALMGALAYRTLKGKGKLADVLGTGQRGPDAAGAGSNLDPTSATGGSGGLDGGGLGAGLKDLLDRFRQTGHQDTAQSWVSTGANRPIAPAELEEVLGAERIEWLMQQTGLPKEQLLAGLSSELPDTIDKLTPGGQVPTDDELEQRLRH